MLASQNAVTDRQENTQLPQY